MRLCTVVMFLMICFPDKVRADEKILIAAASDLNFAMNKICHDFEKAHPGVKVEVSYGSSGNFYAQIKQGAPYDIFFCGCILSSASRRGRVCTKRSEETLRCGEDCALDT